MIQTWLSGVVLLFSVASSSASSAGHVPRNESSPARSPRSSIYHHPAYSFFHLAHRHPFVTLGLHEARRVINDPRDPFIPSSDRPAARGNFDDSAKDNSLLGVEGRVLPFGGAFLRNYAAFPRLATLGSWHGSACISPNGESGVCSLARICSAYGGRASGSCAPLASVCCINTVSRCGSVVTLNNTYWQSSAPVEADSTCSLTVRLNPASIEQRKNPVCQVRLDFEEFNIAQPNSQTVCNADTFRVGGAVNKVPVICGQNAGQHMYLVAPSSTSDLQLVFSFGALNTVERNWRIRIALLPCSADYLAPVDCLQYFTQATGTVRSFNWRPVVPSFSFPRQLANQDYNICFRTEQITSGNTFAKVASSICFAPCIITTAVAGQLSPLAFSLTGDSTQLFPAGLAGAGTNNQQCGNNDYVIIDGATDSNTPTSFNDRFCGNQLTATPGPLPATLCTTARPFKVLYRTDGSESATEAGNNGFCLRFEQRT